MITLRAIRHSLSQILAVGIFLLVIIILASCFMYVAEQETVDPKTGLIMRTVNGKLEVSPFQSIPHTFYWAITTITTTGYGSLIS
jgi:hypothetical protein